MSDSLIILCPGQGAQHVGMGQAWAAHSPQAKAVFEEANDVLGIDLASTLFDGPEDQVHRTDIAQAGLFACAIASAHGAQAAGNIDLSAGNVIASAGLSLGEYTALHLAGVISFEDGLQLVRQRGLFMQEAAEASDGSMVALIGADEAQATELCDRARGDDVLVPANFNCPGQIVISGSTAACERAVTVAGEMEMRAAALTVAGAFHSPLMQPAADRMADELAQVAFNPPAFPVASNVTGQMHGDDVDQIKQLLVQQITHPVRFEQNLTWLLANVSGKYIELAPGKVLSGLVRRTDRKTKVENCAQP
jgi:[acyl-carrier-protein] S-malonyltransferase